MSFEQGGAWTHVKRKATARTGSRQHAGPTIFRKGLARRLGGRRGDGGHEFDDSLQIQAELDETAGDSLVEGTAYPFVGPGRSESLATRGCCSAGWAGLLDAPPLRRALTPAKPAVERMYMTQLSTALLIPFVLFVTPSTWTASSPTAPRRDDPALAHKRESAAVNRRETKAPSSSGSELLVVNDGVRLLHSRHTVDFSPDGVHFAPQCGGPDWQWRLKRVGTEAQKLVDADASPIIPLRTAPGVVSYARNGLIEQYVARTDGVEQQFVIPRRIDLQGADLVIDGTIVCAGAFETSPGGWQWRTPEGAVTLGDVYVHDAHGVPPSGASKVNGSSALMAILQEAGRDRGRLMDAPRPSSCRAGLDFQLVDTGA